MFYKKTNNINVKKLNLHICSCDLFSVFQERNLKPGERGSGSESLSNKVRNLEAKLNGAPAMDKKPKDLIRAVGEDRLSSSFMYSQNFANLVIPFVIISWFLLINQLFFVR